MFQSATVVVNAGLVQLPWSCGEIMRTRAGPAAAVDDVDVVVDAPAAVVVVDPPAAVVVVVELAPTVVVVVAVPPPAGALEGVALGGGSLELPELVPFPVDPPPVSPLIHIPAMAAIRTAVKSCQVFQDRRSLILSSPGLGWSDDSSGAPVPFEGDVTDHASILGAARSSKLQLNTS